MHIFLYIVYLYNCYYYYDYYYYHAEDHTCPVSCPKVRPNPEYIPLRIPPPRTHFFAHAVDAYAGDGGFVHGTRDASRQACVLGLGLGFRV